MDTTIRTTTFAGTQGVTLSADIGGDPDAPPVLLLHGGGQTRHSWGTALRSLVAGGYHVINLDARGHGDSGWAPDGSYQLPRLADDLACVIATLKRPPVLVGASMGGATSLYLVGNRTGGATAAGIVLVDIVPSIEQEGSKRIGDFMRANPEGFANLDEAAEAVAAYNPHRPRPKDPSGLMKNLRRRDGRLHWHWDPMFVRRPISAEPPQFREPLVDAASRVTIPAMLVRGLKSDIVSEAGVQELRGLIPHLEVLDVQGAGHMVAGDRNDAFNDGVIGFLERVAGKPGV